jgi:hypothetical protein
MPRRPIRVHAALAGWGVLAVGGGGGGGGSGGRQSVGLGTRCCRSACPCVQTHGLHTRRVPACPCVECATHTETELGAGYDSRDTARGAYARLAGLFGFALRIAHAAWHAGSR